MSSGGVAHYLPPKDESSISDVLITIERGPLSEYRVDILADDEVVTHFVTGVAAEAAQYAIRWSSLASVRDDCDGNGDGCVTEQRRVWALKADLTRELQADQDAVQCRPSYKRTRHWPADYKSVWQ